MCVIQSKSLKQYSSSDLNFLESFVFVHVICCAVPPYPAVQFHHPALQFHQNLLRSSTNMHKKKLGFQGIQNSGLAPLGVSPHHFKLLRE